MTVTIQDNTCRQTAMTSASVNLVNALYIHVPFCSHKCHYCDFYSIVDQSGRQTVFIEAIKRELTRWTVNAARAGNASLRPRTVFVGGGTPSLLRPALWQTLLEFMQRQGVFERVEEFTVEANPDTVGEQLVDVLAAAGVNRVSLGVQSFHRSLLATLQREHEPAHVPRAIRLLRRGGIENINVDLMFAIPGQTTRMLDADLDAALDLNPRHLSCYNLTYEPGTPMTSRKNEGMLCPVPESLERIMYQRVMERLDRAGLTHYEISNWGSKEQGSRTAETQETPKTGHREPAPAENSCDSALSLSCSFCLHNLMYWTNADWIGLGPSAASHVNGHRWKNKSDLGRYIADSPRPEVVESERLNADRQLGEQLMLGLRLLRGIDCNWLRPRMPADDERWDTIDDLVGMGMLEFSYGRLRLTEQGLFVADAVITKLL